MRVQLRILADDGPGGRGKLAAITTGTARYIVAGGQEAPRHGAAGGGVSVCLCVSGGSRPERGHASAPGTGGQWPAASFFWLACRRHAPQNRRATPLHPLLQLARPCASILDDRAAHCQYRVVGRALGGPRCFMRVSSLCFHCASSVQPSLLCGKATTSMPYRSPRPPGMHTHRPPPRGLKPKRQLDSIIIHFVCKHQPRRAILKPRESFSLPPAYPTGDCPSANIPSRTG